MDLCLDANNTYGWSNRNALVLETRMMDDGGVSRIVNQDRKLVIYGSSIAELVVEVICETCQGFGFDF